MVSILIIAPFGILVNLLITPLNLQENLSRHALHRMSSRGTGCFGEEASSEQPPDSQCSMQRRIPKEPNTP